VSGIETPVEENIPSSAPQSSLPVDARAAQGAWLLIASLSIFFLSSIVLYVLYIAARLSQTGQKQSLELPASFIPSTLLLVGVSVALEIAYRAARRDRVRTVKRAMIGACIMGIGFLVVQGDGMKRLLDGMAASQTPSESVYAYTFVLAFLHAAHVVGGIIGLWWTTRNAMRGRYDHERSFGLKFCALYWHFLDVVWVVLIASFLIAGWVVKAGA
jgi:cytochrome c oxidase subunit 3